MNKLWGCLCVLVLIVTACGGGDGGETTAPASDQTSGDRSNDDGGSGDGDASGGGDGGSRAALGSGDLPSSVPDDFPIAIPSGWEVDVNAEIGLTVSAPRLLYPADAYDDIVAFYDEWTEAQAEEYARTEGPDSITYTGHAGSPRLIAVTRDHEERDQTWTQLVASGSADEG